MEIHIFKTNIGKLCSNCEVHKVLEAHPQIRHWAIDHEDIDCVLRIVTATLSPGDIVSMIGSLGYDCSELE